MGARHGRIAAMAVALLVTAACGGGEEATSSGAYDAGGDSGSATAATEAARPAEPETAAEEQAAGAAEESFELPAPPGAPLPPEDLPLPPEDLPLPPEDVPPPPDEPVVEDPGVNAFVDPQDDALSTFATDVDTASYALARSAVTSGALPDPAGVRVEEFVNAFPQGYEPPPEDAFAIHVDGAPAPFTGGAGPAALVRIGLQAAASSGEARPATALTFLIDVSGSMAEEQRLATVQRALALLASQLRGDDTVAIVTYGDGAQVVLPPTPAGDAGALQAAIDGLEPQGSTNAEAGLRLAYQLAREHVRPAATNRVVLASDGIANVGLTDPDALLAAIEADAAAGIELVTVGVGVSGYRDALMERLANAGDGSYSYVDSFAEAQRLFVDELPSVLETVALDTKVQVAFDPERVAGYRLVGYENRAVPDDRFRDDTVDAGAVGAGHSVTALYEVVPHDGAEGDLATVQLRWTDPATREVRETAAAVSTADLAPAFEAADPHLQLDAIVAQYAEVLRQSHWASAALPDVAAHADRLAAAFPDEPAVAEFAGLARQAATLPAP